MECNLTGSVIDAWIVKQHSNVEYTISDGTDTVRCRLVETITGPGQFRVIAADDQPTGLSVRSLHAHRVKLFNGVDTPWGFGPTTADRLNIRGN